MTLQVSQFKVQNFYLTVCSICQVFQARSPALRGMLSAEVPRAWNLLLCEDPLFVRIEAEMLQQK